MERYPEDIAADPFLRPEFVAQESWDEYVEEQISEVEAEDPAMAAELKESDTHPVYQYWDHVWRKKLNPDTRLAEIFYLKGFTDRAARMAAIGQLHAMFREAAQDQGLFEIPFVEGVEEFNLGER